MNQKNLIKIILRKIIMGLSLQFLIGAPKEMLDALSECDYDRIDLLTEMKADFSLHLQPRDLQILSDCAAKFTKKSLKPFRTALVCYFDESDRGYFLIHDDWVSVMATIDIRKSKTITAEWFKRMAEIYPDEQIGEPNPAAETAVCDLIKLCKHAALYHKPVIHIWTA